MRMAADALFSKTVLNCSSGMLPSFIFRFVCLPVHWASFFFFFTLHETNTAIFLKILNGNSHMESFIHHTQTSFPACIKPNNTRSRVVIMFTYLSGYFSASWQPTSWKIYTFYSKSYHDTFTDTKILPDPAVDFVILLLFVFNTKPCCWREPNNTL